MTFEITVRDRHGKELLRYCCSNLVNYGLPAGGIVADGQRLYGFRFDPELRPLEPTELLPRFRSHKVVRAAKIIDLVRTHFDRTHFDRWILTVATPDGARAIDTIKREWFDKHDPEIGGYLVVYEDGHQSYSPAAAFEAGYTRIEESRSC